MATYPHLVDADPDNASGFRPEHFEREDGAPDSLFYATPRLVAHIDDAAIEAACRIYDELLPENARILDLMSSYLSHLPPGRQFARVAGLGMNEPELRANTQLTDFVIHDLNRDPHLPYEDGEFDAAVMTVSVQYLTNPVEVFREIARVLVPGAPFVITYSNRMFPTKAVRIWRMLDDRERASLIATYFKEAGGFEGVSARDCSIRREGGGYNDPLFAVWAHRNA